LWRGEDGLLRACFRSEDQAVRQLPIYSLPEHVTAWAMTVHKSQGSEFESVLLIMLTTRKASLYHANCFTPVLRVRAGI